MDKNRILLDLPEESPPHKQEESQQTIPKKYFYILIGAFTAIVVFFLIGGFYWYWQKSKEQVNEGKDPFLKNLPELSLALKEKYYYPRELITPALESAVKLYKEGFLSKAEKEFQSIINHSADPLEKSVAYTYLGIISLDLEKFPLAKHYFQLALKFKENYIPAVVNLAITEYKLGNVDEAYRLAETAKTLSPNDSLVALLTGNLLMNVQGASEAEKEFRRGVQLEPEEPINRYNLAISLLRQGKAQEAVVEFQHFLTLYPTHALVPNVLAYLGQIYYSVDQYERALEYYKRAVGLAPDNAKFYYNLGVIYLRLKDEVSAKEAFKKAMNLGATDPEVFEKLSYAFEEFQDLDLAIKTLERSIQYHPDHIPTLFRLAELYQKKNDYLKSAEVYRKIVNRTPGTEDTIRALKELGNLYIKMERYEDAVFVLKKAVDIDPNPKAEVLYELGRAYYHGGRKDKAIEVWKYALDKSSVNPEEKEKLHIILAKAYQNLGSYDLALQELKKINIHSGNASKINYEYGLLYKNLKNYDQAIAHFLKVFESIDSSIEQKKESAMHIAEIYLLTKDTQQLDFAKTWINKAIRLDNEDPKLKIIKAKIHLASSTLTDIEQAIEILLPMTYEELPPSLMKEVYLTLGEAYYTNKEYQRALQSFNKVLSIDPFDEQALQYRQKTIAYLEGKR